MSWGAVIVGVGGLAGGIIASGGASDAADAQEAAANQAAEVQWKMYQQGRQDLAPWREAGEWALGRPSYQRTEYDAEINQLQNELGQLRGGTSVNALSAGKDLYRDPRDPKYPGASLTPYGDYGQGDYGDQLPYDPTAIAGPESKPGLPPGFGKNPPRDFANWSGGARGGDFNLPQTNQPQGTPYDQQGIDERQQRLNELLELQAGAEGETVEGTGLQGMIERGPGEFEESPGYQFTLNEGLNAQQNALSAMGRNRSGQHLKASAQYAEGLASTEYDNFLKRWYQSLNPYQSLAGLGQTSAGQTASMGMSAGQGIAQSNLYAGDASAAGSINQANALTGAITGGANQLLYQNSLRNLQPQQPSYNTFPGYNPGYGGYGQSAGYK